MLELTPWSLSLKQLWSLSWSRCMEPEGSLHSSQEPDTWLYPQWAEVSPLPRTLCCQDSFLFYALNFTWVCHVIPFSEVFQPTWFVHFTSSHLILITVITVIMISRGLWCLLILYTSIIFNNVHCCNNISPRVQSVKHCAVFTASFSFLSPSGPDILFRTLFSDNIDAYSSLYTRHCKTMGESFIKMHCNVIASTSIDRLPGLQH